MTVYPSILLSSGPAQHSYLRRGCVCVLDCWVTFRGRLPLSPKKHDIQAVGCKRRNFRQEHCGLLCLHGYNMDCRNARRLPQSFTAGTASSVRSEAALFGLLQVWKAAGWGQRECWDWHVTRHYQRTQRCQIMTVVFHLPEILSCSVTLQLHSLSERLHARRAMIQSMFSRSYCSTIPTAGWAPVIIPTLTSIKHV